MFGFIYYILGQDPEKRFWQMKRSVRFYFTIKQFYRIFERYKILFHKFYQLC